MPQDQGRESGDGFRAELSDLRTPPGPAGDAPGDGAHLPWQRRSSPGRRVSRLVVLLAIGLVAAVLIAANLPGARSAAIGLFIRPTPTQTQPPNVGDYYLLPNPPGVTVWLDGSPVPTPPLPGTRPLHLTAGRHNLEWLPGWFPFNEESCVVSVPRTGDDTCAFQPGYSLPASLIPAGINAIYLTVIETRESLTTLPASQASALTGAIQAVLDARTSTTTVAPGEHYYSYTPNGSGRVTVATQPLRATLRLVLRGPGAPGTCALASGAPQPCRAPGQDCSEFCTLTNPSLALSGYTWPAGVVVSADWTYTTLAGQVVAQHVGEPGLNANLAVMLLDWDGSQWSVTPVIGNRVSTPEADDALCDPARNWLASGPLSGLLRAADAGTGQHATFRYASSQELTGGCVVRISNYGQGGTAPAGPPALFLERFGVLLAVNGAAHVLWPGLPHADAAEVADAAQLANSANISY